jgi:hypothetical protein
MLKKLTITFLAIVICQTIVKSQNSEQADSAVLTLGFSTYLAHTDKYASGFDIYSDSEGFTYVEVIQKIKTSRLPKEHIKQS